MMHGAQGGHRAVDSPAGVDGHLPGQHRAVHGPAAADPEPCRAAHVAGDFAVDVGRQGEYPLVEHTVRAPADHQMPAMKFADGIATAMIFSTPGHREGAGGLAIHDELATSDPGRFQAGPMVNDDPACGRQVRVDLTGNGVILQGVVPAAFGAAVGEGTDRQPGRRLTLRARHASRASWVRGAGVGVFDNGPRGTELGASCRS